MQQHRAAWRRSFSWLVLLIFSPLSCMPQTQLNQTPTPVSGAAPKAQPLDVDFFTQPATQTGFRTQEFVYNPDSPNVNKLKPRILNTHIGTQTDHERWHFTFAVPPNKTTTIQPIINRTEPCQTSFNNWFIWPIEPPENASDPYIVYGSVGVSNLATTKDGAYTLTLRDEIGQEFTYTVYVNNGNPPVCPSPTPTPSPEPTPTPPGGGNGGNNGGGGNGGNGGGNGGGGNEPCTCGADGFSVLNNKKCPPTCSGMNPKINKQPVEVRHKERCRTGTTSTQKDPDFKLLNVYDFDKAPNKPDLVFVFTKGTPKEHRSQVINDFAKYAGGRSQAKAFSKQNGRNVNFSDNLRLSNKCEGLPCIENMSYDKGGLYATLKQLGHYPILDIIKADLNKEYPQYEEEHSSDMEIFAVAVDMDKSGSKNHVVERIANSPTKTTGLRITLDTSQDDPGHPIKPHSSLSVKIGRKSNGEFYVDCGPLGDNV